MKKDEISVTYTEYKASKIELHQSTAASTCWCGPQSRLSWVEMAFGFPEGPSYPGHSPLQKPFFHRAAP